MQYMIREALFLKAKDYSPAPHAWTEEAAQAMSQRRFDVEEKLL